MGSFLEILKEYLNGRINWVFVRLDCLWQWIIRTAATAQSTFWANDFHQNLKFVLHSLWEAHNYSFLLYHHIPNNITAL